LEMAYENTVKLDNIMSRMLSLFHDESFKQETQKEKPCININQFILKLYRAELSPYLSILSFPEENLLLHAQSELSASPSALHKIFSEIMINLRRNTPPGGKVQITTKDEHDYVHLTIENSSEGIPPKSIDLLFDPLYRYQDSLTHSSGFEYGQGGIGMGLTIIKQLVINMGGNIWFENRLPYVVGQENRVALHIQLRKLIH
ncbi:MAG: ATP-binding protein, partial [Gammaproteobacteria bacterium]|nr:ATP-binding protein [Gammaproteobacteria bacterium]MBT6479888.1 ATP-binding protein [Gammaproteobacteria bacterium]